MGFLLAWAVFHFSLQPLLHCTAPLRGAAALVASTLSKRGAVYCPCPWELHVVCPCAVRVTTTVDHPGRPSSPCHAALAAIIAFVFFSLCERAPMWPAPCLSLYLSLSLSVSLCRSCTTPVQKGG